MKRIFGHARARGFTLSEIMISMALLSLLIAGVTYGNLFGLKLCELTKAKLTTSDEARKTVGQMAEEIRGCTDFLIGSVAGGSFAATTPGLPQAGNALLIYPTTNTTQYVLYLLNAADKTFRRSTSAANSTRVLVTYVTNATPFRVSDARGNVLTNQANNRVVHLSLEIFRPRGLLPSDDAYQIETSVSRRLNN